MNHHPLHLDAHYAETSTQFKRNVVVGNYIYSLLLGMSVADVSGKAIANLEVESLRHVAPTFHGDTIYGETTVLDKQGVRIEAGPWRGRPSRPGATSRTARWSASSGAGSWCRSGSTPGRSSRAFPSRAGSGSAETRTSFGKRAYAPPGRSPWGASPRLPAPVSGRGTPRRLAGRDWSLLVRLPSRVLAAILAGRAESPARRRRPRRSRRDRRGPVPQPGLTREVAVAIFASDDRVRRSRTGPAGRASAPGGPSAHRVPSGTPGVPALGAPHRRRGAADAADDRDRRGPARLLDECGRARPAERCGRRSGGLASGRSSGRPSSELPCLP